MPTQDPDFDHYAPTQLTKKQALGALKRIADAIRWYNDGDWLGEIYADDWTDDEIKAYNEFEYALSNLLGSVRIAKCTLLGLETK